MIIEHQSTLFHRFEGNPILTARHWPYRANAVFNPAAIKFGDEILLLVRVEDMKGFSHLTAARSYDGKTGWRVDDGPTLEPDENHLEERWGLEDPRIVRLEDTGEYAVTYVSFSQGGPVVSLATTTDFAGFKRYGALVPPEDKDASLFPRRIGGRYALLHRPIIRGEAHIWISFSPDLNYWGGHRVVLPARGGQWDSSRVGLGPPPIETPEGWLVIYHGVRNTAAGSIYRAGMALLDLDEPWRVIRRTNEWCFGPSAPYEITGDVPGVTFPTGLIWRSDENTLHLYYGAADSSVCMATADTDEVMEYLRTCPPGQSSLG